MRLMCILFGLIWTVEHYFVEAYSVNFYCYLFYYFILKIVFTAAAAVLKSRCNCQFMIVSFGLL